MPRPLRIAAWLLVALALSGAALAQSEGPEEPGAAASGDHDLYLFGMTVDVLAPVEGDLVAAGGDVNVAGPVHADLMAAGGRVSVTAPVGDDLRAAGGQVRLAARVGDDAILAGGAVRLEPGSVVGGRAWLAGGTIRLDGRIEGALRAAGERVILGGEVFGDARIIAQELELLPDVRIHGSLIYRSPEPTGIPPTARIGGPIEHHAFERTPQRAPGVTQTGLELAGLLSLITTALVAYLLAPGFALTAARRIGSAPWASLGLGLAVLAATPLAAGLLMASVLGLWLGLALLAAWLLLLPGGFVTGLLAVADRGARLVQRQREPGRGTQVLAITVVAVALWLLSGAPWVGGWIVLAMLLFGLGALVRELTALRRAA